MFSEPIKVKHWTESAVCRSTDPDLFFPEVGKSGFQAKKICSDCPVRAECLSEALNAGDDLWGIWAGFGMRERAGLRDKLTNRGRKPVPDVDTLKFLLDSMKPIEKEPDVRRRWSGK